MRRARRSTCTFNLHAHASPICIIMTRLIDTNVLMPSSLSHRCLGRMRGSVLTRAGHIEDIIYALARHLPGPFLAVFLLVNARGAGLQGIVYVVLTCHLHSQCQDEEKPHSSLHVHHMALPDAAQRMLMKPARLKCSKDRRVRYLVPLRISELPYVEGPTCRT